MMRSFRRCGRGRRASAALLALLFATIALAVPGAAQDLVAPGYTSALRPADVSSPRDTLRSFHFFSDALNRARALGGPLEDRHLYFLGAEQTIDFASTIYGRSINEKLARIAMLKEVLDRIELPPLGQIPGADEVAEGSIDSWTIPGTFIRIVRKSEGPNAGDFLISAASIGDIDLAYRRIKDLPYKPGESGYYEDWLNNPPPEGAAAREVKILLGGLTTSSPRATLEGFLASMNAAYRIAAETEAALTATPPEITVEEAREAEVRAGSLLRRAASALDVSKVPAVQRQDEAIEAAMMLKEILDRLRLPPIETVPDLEAVEAAETRPLRWRLPGTRLWISEVSDEERSGTFLFDPGSVARIAASYRQVAELPYRSELNPRIIAEYTSPEISPGFYEGYISTPGTLVPSAHFLGRLTQKLPESLLVVQAGQTRWQWIGLGLVCLVVLLGGYLVFRLVSLTSRKIDGPLGSWTQVLSPVLVGYGVRAAARIVDNDLNLTGDVLGSVRFIGGAVALFLFAWAIWRASIAVADSITASPRISDSGLDGSLVRIVSGLVAIVAALIIIVTGLRDLGVDAVPLIAGLGVGGLAVALAIRPTLENLIGGIILFADKPIRVGDYCSFGGMNGTVESIGVRSTQIRALDRTLISVPNAKFADMELINWAQCDRMLITATIGLRYETADDQLRNVLVKIREMLHAHPRIDRETVRVRFAGYGASSLDLGVRIYALTRDWNDFHAIREDVFFRIKTIVEASGTSFAFPSQTLYLGRDDGLDQDLTDRSVREVEDWRQEGDLPFPRLRRQRMDELEGTLDYPPRGSAEAASQIKQAPEPLSAENPGEDEAPAERGPHDQGPHP